MRPAGLPTREERASARQRPEPPEDRRGRENRASRWASANQRSASARAEWACPKVRPKAWALGARPPLWERDSQRAAARETRREPAAVWPRPRDRPRPPTRRSGQRAAA